MPDESHSTEKELSSTAQVQFALKPLNKAQEMIGSGFMYAGVALFTNSFLSTRSRALDIAALVALATSNLLLWGNHRHKEQLNEIAISEHIDFKSFRVTK